MNFTLITALLCSCSLISVSVSEFHTEEVRPGGEVTLHCSNFSKVPDHIFWFKLDNRANISRICSVIFSNQNASFYDGYNEGRFDLTSNTTTLFLNIKQVDLSDSGLYFCGHHCQEKPFIVSATYLKVQDMFRGILSLTNLLLASVIIFLFMIIIGLFVKIRKHHTARTEEQNPQDCETVNSDALNYAALTFKPKAKGSKRAPSESELETNLVYTSTS